MTTAQVPSHAHHTHPHFDQPTYEYATRPSHAPSVNTRMRQLCIPQFQELRMHAHGFPFRVPSPRPSIPGLTRSSVVHVLYFIPRDYPETIFRRMTMICR